MIKLQYKLLSETAKAPTKKRPSDAGWDFYADCMYSTEGKRIPLIKGNDYYITNSNILRVGLGVATALPDDYYLHLMDRSGLGVEGVHRTAGVIEGTYRNELVVCLTNLVGVKIFKLGDKIIQGIILPIFESEAEEVSQLPESNRGRRGFGSSGDGE